MVLGAELTRAFFEFEKFYAHSTLYLDVRRFRADEMNE